MGTRLTDFWKMSVDIRLIALGAAAALIPMIGAGIQIFHGRPERLISLYPLLLLPLFFSPERERPFFINLLLAGGCVLAAFGIFFHRMSLVWAGSFWNVLAVLNFGGRPVSTMAALLIFCIPPVSDFPAVIAGFEIRLFLTRLVAHALAHVDPQAAADGSRIFFQGVWVTVDRACEGMKMAGAAGLLGLSLAVRSAWTGRILIGTSLLFLWLLANFARILVLIFFRIPAESAAHEIIGLILFFCIIVFPIGMAALVFPAGRLREKSEAPISKRRTFWVLIPSGLVGILFFVFPPRPASRMWPGHIQNFTLNPESTKSDPRIAVYHAGEMVLILKRDLFAFGTAHDPRICYEAAGYVVSDAGATPGPGGEVRRALLTKESRQLLYWWFAWPGGRTTSDWLWRVRQVQEDDVVQWNLSGPDESSLQRTMSELARPSERSKTP